MEKQCYIALGSNIGDRSRFLEEAIQQLAEHDKVTVTCCSSIYETDPVGYTDQSPFLNMVVEVSTSLPVEQLLEVTQKIERYCGRERHIRWGPRTLDLDILLYDQENREMENLIIPHPRMWERAFVLIPLMELNPSIVAPSGKTIEQVVRELKDKEGVTLWKQETGASVYGRFES
ncbi:2-amino-4-hydroxy-6-hydroxymethyldihydropteridine diphosphokinase [Halalkalibacterium halodurans]|jgi:2-amino-4-hydroxy-6-hydroxymethyldihydropteridine diphosphokinase|uniref:2-amino-4-hydroxy-6-hydroxymethyldihydropteridine diphosphokinase n=2 Tax=Halalkalibacterium halodurans TaxID=86665 RepID=Q9KGG7_HALH5|nr:2-amino-4-hydroxy-6-hydroxymethyldihydropteridine diphosphokinase [Halalkalibacterium halodurans]MDY7220597.1 2-amino-4-hydroxy-6-hydroxymethyldihydropteridine diphosphokinase [Halalkalibacterium halodurans]MDY7239836.1 2-amino-4-hydroxy-6-hydroxymethyldihydropteridine diphosphokinase [Halalkalibacterium halodurans]MED3648132.1 2-amino-4-hydroxy-6-hydroxymethyldihydropteridine diphosphokinase [Halalkalibacterium halodurans]MED4080447.1 2-amino-4-hydroxy-6-hydroxymethyldihydropteridine diphos